MGKKSRTHSVLLILLVVSLLMNIFLSAKLIAKDKGPSIKDYVGLWECVDWKTHYLEIKKDGSVFLVDYRKDESQKQFIIMAYSGRIKDASILFDGEYDNPETQQLNYPFADNFVDHFSSVEDVSFTRGNAVGIITRTGADSIKLAVDGTRFGIYDYFFTRCDSLNLDRITTVYPVVEQSDGLSDQTQVWWSQYGKVYHTHNDCSALDDSIVSGTIEEAIAANKTKLCSFCASRDGIDGIATGE